MVVRPRTAADYRCTGDRTELTCGAKESVAEARRAQRVFRRWFDPQQHAIRTVVKTWVELSSFTNYNKAKDVKTQRKNLP